MLQVSTCVSHLPSAGRIEGRLIWNFRHLHAASLYLHFVDASEVSQRDSKGQNCLKGNYVLWKLQEYFEDLCKDIVDSFYLIGY